MIGHRARVLAILLGLQVTLGVVPAPATALAAQDPPAWWFCRALGKRAITGDAVLIYADSANMFSRSLDPASARSHVFSAPGASSADVREQFLVAAARQYPEVVNWRATCDGFATQDAATRADKVSRARDRAAFPPAEWFVLQGFTFRRG